MIGIHKILKAEAEQRMTLTAETKIPVRDVQETVLKLWNNWELRVLVLLSLSLQLSLAYFGRCRRYSVQPYIHIFLWFCYLVADSVAIIALGVIATKQAIVGVENGLWAFWAPFMVLHLGGQDTITSYAVQDNDLWLRHLLKLIAQSGVAIAVIHRSWKGNWLSFLTYMMLLAGFIKYAERIWVMLSANRLHEHNFNDDHVLKEKEPYIMGAKTNVIGITDGPKGPRYDAFDDFPRFRPLFLNQKIHHRKEEGLAFALRMRDDFQAVFKILEIEIEHAYDTFYTKIPLFCKPWGCIFRCISFSSTIFVLVFFLIKVTPKYKHQQIDLIISYILLIGAVAIEIYAVILLVTCEVGPQWLKMFKRIIRLPTICAAPLCKQTWSNRIGQFNMLSFCMKNNNHGIALPEFFPHLRVWFFNCSLPKLSTELEMYFYKTDTLISNDLKNLVGRTFKEKSIEKKTGFSKNYNSYISGDEKVQVEIYQSIIIWHFATDLCIYTANDDNEEIPAGKEDVIKKISNYMMYILTMCPNLLSSTNAKVSFAKASEQVRKALDNSHASLSRLTFEKIRSYLSTKTNGEFSRCYPELSDSLLVYNAFQVAENLSKTAQKWEILTTYWIEHLGYVATLCQGKNHAKQLLKGGEFLTHVRFLIEHLDLKQSFRKSPTRPQEERTWDLYISSEL